MRVSSNRPIDKVTNSVIAGAIVAVVAWALGAYAGVELPAEVQNALIIIVSAVVAYVTPIRAGEIATE
jgi:Na+/glutamate symporter